MCPKCGSKLNLADDVYRCALYSPNPKGAFECGFIATAKRVREICASLSTSMFFMEVGARDNGDGLNNYGRKKFGSSGPDFQNVS
jgi:hypothetical protein